MSGGRPFFVFPEGHCGFGAFGVEKSHNQEKTCPKGNLRGKIQEGRAWALQPIVSFLLFSPLGIYPCLCPYLTFSARKRHRESFGAPALLNQNRAFCTLAIAGPVAVAVVHAAGVGPCKTSRGTIKDEERKTKQQEEDDSKGSANDPAKKNGRDELSARRLRNTAKYRGIVPILVTRRTSTTAPS